MIDYPLQFAVSVIVVMVIVAFLWRTRKSRLARFPAGWRRGGRAVGRLILVLVMLVVLVLALDATRYMTADVCLEFQAGSEWCLHDAALESDN